MEEDNIIEFPELLYYGEDEYLGNGSYGFIYIIPHYNRHYVLKKHKITGDDQNPSGWMQEYTMHKNIYNSCNHLLTRLAISIVKPILFNYGIYNGNTLKRLSSEEGASHCYIIMERIYGRKTENEIVNNYIERKLNILLGSSTKYTPNHSLPPYLYFGSLETENVITLDLLKGVTLHKFPNEALNYCTIGDDAYTYYKNMMASFFIIAGAGFAPRDIEYVLNGNRGDELMTILDFNEVMRWDQRKQKYKELMERPIITM